MRPGAKWTRRELVAKLASLGVECRPIVTGNFAKNEVLKWMDHEICGALDDADWIDQNGLFIGNHPYPVADQLKKLGQALA